MDTKTQRRQKRYLTFTDDTQWGVFATVSIPLHPDTTVSVAWFFEAQYYSVANATYFVDPLIQDAATISRKRDKRSAKKIKDFITRSSLYLSLESMLEKHGYPGRSCLLRAICESATSHFLHNGLLGDVIHLALTPSTSISEDDIEDTYYEAEYNGLENRCSLYAEKCPTNPLNYISSLVEEII